MMYAYQVLRNIIKRSFFLQIEHTFCYHETEGDRNSDGKGTFSPEDESGKDENGNHQIQPRSTQNFTTTTPTRNHHFDYCACPKYYGCKVYFSHMQIWRLSVAMIARSKPPVQCKIKSCNWKLRKLIVGYKAHSCPLNVVKIQGFDILGSWAYIYVYIYMCVCVCVKERQAFKTELSICTKI